MAKGPDIRAGLHFKGGTASVPARREILRLLRDGRHTAGEIAANFQPATGIDRAKFARVRESVILCSGMVRGLTELQYQPLKSWTRSRRVIAKAEVLQDKDNPRFIVTNLPAEGFADQQQSPDRFCGQSVMRLGERSRAPGGGSADRKDRSLYSQLLEGGGSRRIRDSLHRSHEDRCQGAEQIGPRGYLFPRVEGPEPEVYRDSRPAVPPSLRVQHRSA